MSVRKEENRWFIRNIHFIHSDDYTEEEIIEEYTQQIKFLKSILKTKK
jgi:hypothetical protein